MMIVGLTGGIGSGKSTVAKMFRKLGVPVYDSDHEAKVLMVTSPKVRDGLIKLFGEEIYDDEGNLNRKFIADKVFKDAALLQKLNAIVHPTVREHFLEWAAGHSTPYVIQETALIFENNAQDKYDQTILVTAPMEARAHRVMERDGVDREAVLDRMRNQMTDDEKAGLAHFRIENIDLKTTKNKVKQLHAKLLALAAKF
ncbi:dephospho-CoA kinase [Flagellimonas pelagia]|uniref:Dephospho-CoA kinase n=1 Tax=Flagellimonas pelagia TaxID=2306998 RepID=A0A3A1NI50_9FLAO|nr:dephospho-CoA kinase [Allomuricauda maritima]RIV42023.1 dephospho-CoA kinase [Allomuricauda maritima]TXJ90904.1 dephospho-CoA kinase [Allomuricauda maritima]